MRCQRQSRGASRKQGDDGNEGVRGYIPLGVFVIPRGSLAAVEIFHSRGLTKGLESVVLGCYVFFGLLGNALRGLGKAR